MRPTPLIVAALTLASCAVLGVPTAAACDDVLWHDERTVLGVPVSYAGRDTCDCAVMGVGSPAAPADESFSELCFASRDLIDVAHAYGVPP